VVIWSDVDDREVRERLLRAAADLFYRHGVAAVGMDDIRAASGVPLKRLYQSFSSKDRLVEAYLSRRDEQWLAALAQRVERVRDPRQRVLAAFSFLAEWFATPGFRGCAFINAFGELGGRDGRAGQAASIARLHKKRLRRYLAGLAADAGAAAPGALGAQLLILMDGAIVSAATGANARAAADARAAARALLDIACEAGTTGR
jgi:AcrR family transcriptional regulator